MQDAGLATEWDRQDVAQLLTLERLDEKLFRNRLNHRNINGSLFGGQVLAQALGAAQATVEGRTIRSLHAYFLRSGKLPRSVFYQVEATRDGGTFSTRRVTAIQFGETIFHMEAAFHRPEPGYDHQVAAPSVPPPDALDNLETIAARDPRIPAGRVRPGSVEIRPVDPDALFAVGDGRPSAYWIRPARPIASDDPAVHARLLCWLSDMGLARAPLERHEPWIGPSRTFVASIDHAIWFHRPSRADDWLLFTQDSPSASAGTGFARALVHDRAGMLVASIAQEALQRMRV